MVEIAKEVSGTNDSDEAVRLFRQKLNSTESFFNDAPIPKNESNKEAHKKCSSLQGAEKHCPTRWAAMQLWFKEARRVSFFVTVLLKPKPLGYLFFAFLGPFFSCCWLVENVFRQTFRIVGLDGRKCRRAVEQNFHGNFRVKFTWFFVLFSGFLD